MFNRACLDQFFCSTVRTLALFCAMNLSVAVAADLVGGTTSKGTTVDTQSGPVEGYSNNGSHYFLGIPYASPPVGALRWQPPRPPKTWHETLSAKNYGPSCPQQSNPRLDIDLAETSEDCLTINIIAPADRSTDNPLPVLFMIHGGGFMMGNGAIAEFGSAPVYNQAGIIVVSFNYRLGALGFFSHPSLDASNGVNYGVMDMLAALRWVNNNISRFGGDPKRVTIQGISAGAQGVLMLMLNPEAQCLFSAGIAQSHYGGFPGQPRAEGVPPLAGSPEANSVGVQIVSRALATEAGDNPDGNISREALYAMSPGQFAKAITSYHLPIVDGVTLQEETTAMFSQGRQHAVPLISGSTSFDGSVMAASGVSTEFIVDYFGDREAFEVLYQSDMAVSEKQAVMRMFGDVRYAFSGWAAARFMQRVEQPGYAYRFDYVAPAQEDKLPGAPHGSDGQIFAMPNLAVAQTMRSYWINFIKSGNPNGSGLPRWTAADFDNTAVMVFDDNTRLTPGLGRDKMEFLEQRWAERTLPVRQAIGQAPQALFDKRPRCQAR